MNKLLTKEDILKGTDKKHKVMIPELGGEIEIRQLNEEQWSEIESKIGVDIDFDIVYDKNGKPDMEKTKKNFKLKLDVEQIQKMEFEQNLLACRYGMILEMTEQELRKITPPGIIQKIAKEVYKISKVSEEQLNELKMFRE